MGINLRPTTQGTYYWNMCCPPVKVVDIQTDRQTDSDRDTILTNFTTLTSLCEGAIYFVKHTESHNVLTSVLVSFGRVAPV